MCPLAGAQSWRVLQEELLVHLPTLTPQTGLWPQRGSHRRAGHQASQLSGQAFRGVHLTPGASTHRHRTGRAGRLLPPVTVPVPTAEDLWASQCCPPGDRAPRRAGEENWLSRKAPRFTQDEPVTPGDYGGRAWGSLEHAGPQWWTGSNPAWSR